jgi:manganese/zinc/iron transport system ATP- binding protein
MADAPRAVVAGLTVAFGDRRALDDVSLELPRGAVVGLIGPNGAGKTTLLRALLGTVRPAAGTVRVDGTTGFVPQIGPGGWDLPLSAADVALQGSYRRTGWLRRPSAGERDRACAALAAVGMGEHGGRQVGQLSGGQRQRILLARALVQEADLLLLDEPVSGADAPTETAFTGILSRLRGEGRTVVVSSHDLAWASARCDLVCLLAGRVVAFGPPAEALDAGCLAEAYGGQVAHVGGVLVLAPEGHHAH